MAVNYLKQSIMRHLFHSSKIVISVVQSKKFRSKKRLTDRNFQRLKNVMHWYALTPMIATIIH